MSFTVAVFRRFYPLTGEQVVCRETFADHTMLFHAPDSSIVEIASSRDDRAIEAAFRLLGNEKATLRSEDAPKHCSECHEPIQKFLQPGAAWYPCTECDGAKCEDCCEVKP